MNAASVVADMLDMGVLGVALTNVNAEYRNETRSDVVPLNQFVRVLP